MSKKTTPATIEDTKSNEPLLDLSEEHSDSSQSSGTDANKNGNTEGRMNGTYEWERKIEGMFERLDARLCKVEETVECLDARLCKMEARLDDIEGMLHNNPKRSPKLDIKNKMFGKSKPKPELCIYGNTGRASRFVRLFKNLEEKTYTFLDQGDLRDEIPIALVCECTQDRHTNDLDKFFNMITDSQLVRTTIIYIHEVMPTQERQDQFTTREQIKVSPEGDKYKELDYRILDMLFTKDKDNFLPCKTNDVARRELKTFVNEYTAAKLEKRRKKKY